MKTFEGYNPQSPTLRPSLTRGTCMGPDWQNALIWIDSAAQIMSGDYVQIGLKYPDGDVVFIIKQLLCTSDNRWWGRCNDGVFPLGDVVRPFRVVKVVAIESCDPDSPPGQSPHVADEQTQEYFAWRSARALREWQEKGEPRAVVFPGLDAILVPIGKTIAVEEVC